MRIQHAIMTTLSVKTIEKRGYTRMMMTKKQKPQVPYSYRHLRTSLSETLSSKQVGSWQLLTVPINTGSTLYKNAGLVSELLHGPINIED